MLREESVLTTARSSSPRAGGRVASRRRPKTRRRFLLAGLVIVAAIAYMIYAAVQSGSQYYVTASELKAMGQEAAGQPIKIGGQVVDGSIQRNRGADSVSFSLTDGKETVLVTFSGVIPDTFQPGAEAIVEGKVGTDGTFQATTLMAKCASKYVPAS